MQLIQKLNKKRIENLFLVLIVNFYIYRTTIPFFKHLFIFSLVFYFIYHILNNINISFNFLKSFFYDFKLLMILGASFLFAIIISSKLYSVAITDFINIVILLLLFFLLRKSILDISGLKVFIRDFLKITVLIATITSIFHLIYFLGINKSIFSNVDTNFALLPVFFGIIVSFHLLSKTGISKFEMFFSHFLIVLFLTQILISGSRRGGIAILLIVVLFLLNYLLQILKKESIKKKLIVHYLVSLLNLFFVSILLFLFLFTSSFKFKVESFKFIGIKNISILKTNIDEKAYRILKSINKDFKYADLDNVIWNKEFVSEDPSYGWGERTDKYIYPLQGKNNEIVPPNAIGYKMDSSFTGHYDSVLNKCETYSLVTRVKTKPNIKYVVSVYCYVDDLFKGTTVSIGVPNNFYNDGSIQGSYAGYYNLKNKGIWQKLNFSFELGKDNIESIPIYFIFSQQNAMDFSNLMGHVIFAYPDIHEVVADKISILRDRNSSIRLFIKESEKCDILKIQNASVLPIRMKHPFNYIQDLIKEDTTYFGYHYPIDHIETQDFLDLRLNRWKFALQIFTKEFNGFEKTFGGGFDYLNWYGYYFYNDKTRSDWPHNPFLSVLLYSGIVGLIIYVIALSRAIMLYIKYRKEYFIFFIFFLITFFFAFFSVNSPFTPPIWGFFLILPYFIHSVHKRAEKENKVLKEEQD